MIQISFTNLLIMLFLGPVFLVLLGLSFYIAQKNVKNIYKMFKNHKSFKKRMAEVERRKKDEGFTHKWITYNVGGKELHICQETGYCPTINGFFDVDFVQGIVKARQMEEEFNLFKQSEIKKMAEELGIGAEYMQELIERGSNIRSKFVMNKLREIMDSEQKPE